MQSQSLHIARAILWFSLLRSGPYCKRVRIPILQTVIEPQTTLSDEEAKPAHKSAKGTAAPSPQRPACGAMVVVQGPRVSTRRSLARQLLGVSTQLPVRIEQRPLSFAAVVHKYEYERHCFTSAIAWPKVLAFRFGDSTRRPQRLAAVLASLHP